MTKEATTLKIAPSAPILTGEKTRKINSTGCFSRNRSMSTQNVLLITQAPPHTLDASFFDIQRSDAGNARRLLEAHGHDICYHAERNEWLLWDGKRWAIDSKGRKMAGKMKAVLQELRNESLAIIDELTPVVK